MSSESTETRGGSEFLWKHRTLHQSAAPQHQGPLDIVSWRLARGHPSTKNKISPASHPFQVKGRGTEERAVPRLQRGPSRTQRREATESTVYSTSRPWPGHSPLTPGCIRHHTSVVPWEEEHSTCNRKGDVLSTSVLFSWSFSFSFPSFSWRRSFFAALLPPTMCTEPFLYLVHQWAQTTPYLVWNKRIFEPAANLKHCPVSLLFQDKPLHFLT